MQHTSYPSWLYALNALHQHYHLAMALALGMHKHASNQGTYLYRQEYMQGTMRYRELHLGWYLATLPYGHQPLCSLSVYQAPLLLILQTLAPLA